MEWLCEETMEEIDRCINANGILFIIALIRHAGWGKKRIEDFINTLDKTMDEFHRHCIDGVFDYMAEKELSGIGMDLKKLMPKPIPFKMQMQQSKLERKQDVGISEARNLHEKMTEIHGYFESFEKGAKKHEKS